MVPVTRARVTLGFTNGRMCLRAISRLPFRAYWDGANADRFTATIWLRKATRGYSTRGLPDRCPSLDRSAGNALRQLTQDLMPGVFDTSAVQDLGHAGVV